MKKQLIITIGRESGSGGHEIAKKLSEAFHIPFYDKEKIQELVAKETGYELALVKKMDEKPVSRLFSRRLDEFSTSVPEHVARKTFEVIRSMAEEGKSFVLVGRCGEFILRDNPNTVRFFINGREEEKVERMAKLESCDVLEAAREVKRRDAIRKTYHNYYCDTKWGDSRGYDLVINSSVLGIEKSVKVLTNFAEAFLEE